MPPGQQHTNSAGIGARTARAGLWVVGGKLFARGIDFVTLLVLARLLTPTDFGLVAMAMAVLYIVEAVLELPLAQALISVPDPTQEMYETAFTLGLLRGIAIAVLMTALAWPISIFYGEPRVVPLICVLSLAPAARGLVSPRMVVFMREFDFRRDASIEIAGKAAALIVAACMAWLTRSYWAIAAATIATPVVMVIASYVLAPLRPRLTLSEWHRFADMVSWNSVAQLISAFNWQSDKLLLGRFIETRLFGKFAMSETVAALPFQALIQPLARPLLVSFTTARSPAALGEAYLSVTGTIILLVAPIYASFALMAAPMVWAVFGKDWINIAPILSALSIVTMMSLPANVLPGLLMAQDKTRLLAHRYLAELAVRLPASIAGVILFGIPGVIAARAIGTLCAIFYVAVTLRTLTGLSPRVLAARMGRFFAPTALACLPAFALLARLGPAEHIRAAFVHLLAGGLAFALVYPGAVLIVWKICGRPDGPESRIGALILSRLRAAFGRPRNAEPGLRREIYATETPDSEA